MYSKWVITMFILQWDVLLQYMGYIWLYNYTSIYVPIRWAKPWDQLSKKIVNGGWLQSFNPSNAKQWCQRLVHILLNMEGSNWPATCVLLVGLPKISYGGPLANIAIELPSNPILVNGWKPIRKKLTWGPPKKNLAIFLRDVRLGKRKKKHFSRASAWAFHAPLSRLLLPQRHRSSLRDLIDCCIYDKKSHNFWLFQILYQKVTY